MVRAGNGLLAIAGIGQREFRQRYICTGTCTSFPMDIATSLTSYPSADLSRRPQSRSDADYARPQSNGPTVRCCRNVDIYNVNCNLRTHGRGVTDISRWRESASRGADRFDRFEPSPVVCTCESRDNGISPNVTRRVFRVSRAGYFGRPPDYGNDESAAPCITKTGSECASRNISST